MTLEELINSAEVNQVINIAECSQEIENVVFRTAEDGYTYTFFRKGSKSILGTTPSATTWTVKTWKTLAGAKRHFMRAYGWTKN